MNLPDKNANTSAIAEELAKLEPIAGFRGLQVFRFKGDNYPAALYQIGRLREKVFSESGAGRGGDVDLDNLDFGEHAYYQILTWDPEAKEIVSLYRYQPGVCAESFGDQCLRTSMLFDYSESFRKKILPESIELGRSLVNPEAKRARFGFFAIWHGLGAILRIHDQSAYFFGNVSLYKTIKPEARDLLVEFLEKFYPPPEIMLKAKTKLRHKPVSVNIPKQPYLGDQDTPNNRIKKIDGLMQEYGEEVPSILKSYLSLSNDIWLGETVIDRDFGDAFEIGIIVPVENIDQKFRDFFMPKK